MAGLYLTITIVLGLMLVTVLRRTNWRKPIIAALTVAFTISTLFFIFATLAIVVFADPTCGVRCENPPTLAVASGWVALLLAMSTLPAAAATYVYKKMQERKQQQVALTRMELKPYQTIKTVEEFQIDGKH